MTTEAAITPARAPGARAGVVLAGATVTAGVVTYASMVLLGRGLGPAEYGILGSVLSVALIASVAQTALQLECTRLVASGAITSGPRLLRHGALVAAGTAGLTLVLAPLLDRWLRWGGWIPAVALAALLLSQTFTGAALGILLGRGRTDHFGILLVSQGVSRLLAAVVTVLLRPDTDVALWLSAAFGFAVALLGAAQVRAGEPEGGGDPGRFTWSGLTRAAAGAGALLVLLNADLLSARSVLGGTESGWYAFLTVFGRVTFWGTNFLSLWVFPQVAAKGGAGRAVRMAVLVIAGVGTVAILFAALVGRTFVRLLVGPDYLPAAGYAPVFAAAGALIALVQLATYVDVARARHTVGIVVWAGVAVLLVLIRFVVPHRFGAIIWTAVAVLGAVALVGVLLTLRERPAPKLPR